MPFTDARGFRMHWQEGGDGPFLLLFNGWIGSGFLWPRAWVAELESAFRVLRVDHRGTGRSEITDEPFTVHDMAADALAVADAVGAETVSVVGLSMGGIIAQAAALDAPGRLDALVLCSTTPGGTLAVPHPDFLSAVGGSLSEGQGALISAIVPLICAPGFWETAPELVMELAQGWRAAPTSFDVIGRQFAACGLVDFGDRLGEITAPTLVLHGNLDHLLMVQNAHVLAERIPNADKEIYEGVGHMLPWEAPQSAGRVVEFLTRSARPG